MGEVTKLPLGTACGIHGTPTHSGRCRECDAQAAYDQLLDLAGKLETAIDNEPVRLLAYAALAAVGLALGGGPAHQCDGCDRIADPEVYAAAGLSWGEIRNPWDDVIEARFCPICVAENRDAALADEAAEEPT